MNISTKYNLETVTHTYLIKLDKYMHKLLNKSKVMNSVLLASQYEKNNSFKKKSGMAASAHTQKQKPRNFLYHV